jgi:hypothetical protein
VTRAELIELLEVEPRTAGFALEDLADAAAGAWALANLHGRRADAVAARHAAAHAAVSFSHPAAIAETLGISRRRVDQLLRAECRPAEVTAVQRQLGLRAALREAEAVARDGLVRLPARSQRPGGAAALRER